MQLTWNNSTLVKWASNNCNQLKVHGAWTIEITLPYNYGPKIGASTFKKLEVSAVHLKVQLFRSGIFQNLCNKLEISSQYGPDSLKI